ncbi:uncharacterized protein CDAR_295331 [Caerostris darwini]|uniref:Uncharacterized protein n=1 Tax=Caerostris darwini TaxID=1538125 RepID=A0AAV4QSW1_9ARAC|nr:uncharacterized protein CDAR_295331 [Caerostris darwini]
MGYMSSIAVLLWCAHYFFISIHTHAQMRNSYARESQVTTKYALQDDGVKKINNNYMAKTKHFRDIYPINKLNENNEHNLTMEQKIHNKERLVQKIDSSNIPFGSRLRSKSSEVFKSDFKSVPAEISTLKPITFDYSERPTYTKSVESFAKRAPKSHYEYTDSINFPVLNVQNRDVNTNYKRFKDNENFSILRTDVPFYPVGAEYEPERIVKSNSSKRDSQVILNKNALTASGNFNENNKLIKPVEYPKDSFLSESEIKVLDQVVSSPNLTSLQKDGLNIFQEQYPNNRNFKWYQTIPQVSSHVNPVYNAVYNPVGSKSESSVSSKPQQHTSILSSKLMHKFPIGFQINSESNQNTIESHKSNKVHQQQKQKSLSTIAQYNRPTTIYSLPTRNQHFNITQLQNEKSHATANNYIASQKTLDEKLKYNPKLSDEDAGKESPVIPVKQAQTINSKTLKTNDSIFQAISTKQPIILASKQSLLSKNNTLKIASPSKNNTSFSSSKSFISLPMSTIFDTSNENGQYYHYVMNIGQNKMPRRIRVNSVNLFKLLNQTDLRKRIKASKQLPEKIDRFYNHNKSNKINNASVIIDKENKIINETLKSDLKVNGSLTDSSKILKGIPKVYLAGLKNKYFIQNNVSKINEQTITIDRKKESQEQSIQRQIEMVTTTMIPVSEQYTTSTILGDLFGMNTTSDNQPSEVSEFQNQKSILDEHVLGITFTTESPESFTSKIEVFQTDSIVRPPLQQGTESTSFLEDLFAINTSDNTIAETSEKGSLDTLKAENLTDEIMKEILNITEPEMLNTENYNIQTTSTEKPATEQYTTSSFLSDFFEINTTPSILTEDVADNIPVIGDSHNETEENFGSLFITIPQTSLSSVFVEDIKNGTNESYTHIPNNESLFSEISTLDSDINTEFLISNKMNNSLELLSKNISSYETTAKNTNFVYETINSSRISDSNLQNSLSYEQNNFGDANVNKMNINKSISGQHAPILLADILEILNNSSEINTETFNDTAHNDSITLKTHVADFSLNSQEKTFEVGNKSKLEIDPTNFKIVKPLLELLIENAEESGLNIPIVIRVINQTKENGIPVENGTSMENGIPMENGTPIENQSANINEDLNSKNFTNKEYPNDLSNNTKLNNERLNSETISEKEDELSNTTNVFKNIDINSKEQDTTVIPSVKLHSIDDDINADLQILTPAKENNLHPISKEFQDTKYSLGEPNNTFSTEELETFNANNNEIKFEETSDTQFQNAGEHTLILPDHSYIFYPSMVNNLGFQNDFDYSDIVVNEMQNYSFMKEKDFNNEENIFFNILEKASDTNIQPTYDQMQWTPLFLEDNQIEDLENSKNTMKFKTDDNRYETNGLVDPHLIFDYFIPITVKNSTDDRYQKTTNFKGYDLIPTADFIDFYPYKDVENGIQFSVEENKLPSDEFFVLNDGNSPPPGNDQKNEYIFIGNNKAIKDNILSTSFLVPSTDFHNQPIYVLDNDLPKFGTRLRQ